jgi:nitric oxide reductase NorD protein
MAGSAFDSLLKSAHTTEVIGARAMGAVREAFAGHALDQWTEGLGKLVEAGLGPGALINFATASPQVARSHGHDLAQALVPAALSIARAAGPRSATAFLAAAAKAAGLLREHSAFRAWLRTADEIANLAPESADALMQATGAALSQLDALSFRSWALNGIRTAGGDAARRLAYFSHPDQALLRSFLRAPDDVVLGDCERGLKAFLAALWGYHPAIRAAAIRPGGKAPRRSSFDGISVRVPEHYGGFRGDEARRHFRAVLAHIGAHAAYGRQRFPVGTLKHIQIALVGLIEDARVEALAMAEFPGLARLWRRFHHAGPTNALTADHLMARLARALIDPGYRDDDPWVSKGRMLFAEQRRNLQDPSISRTIGGLLGNDLGQMRIQFNPKTHIIEPSYRDDNDGLWDFGDSPPEQAETAEVILEAVRIREEEREAAPEKRDRQAGETPASIAAKLTATPEDEGLPLARHPEWDHISGTMRPDWATVLEYQARPASPDAIDETISRYAAVEARIARLVGAAKVSRPERLRRQRQGDRLDDDACIRAVIAQRQGLVPEPHIYETRMMRSRDLSVLLLLDVSESTRDRVRDTTTTVLALERAAAALLAEAMAGLGDPFAIHAFCSNGREEVRYYRVKDFSAAYGPVTRARLAGLRGMLSTRMGAALRQAGAEVARQPTHRRLILVVTDGEPADVDVADGQYLVEDARKAVQQLSHMGVDVFCVGLDSGGAGYLPRIFGRRNHLVISRIESLPEKLPMLYFRLTV